MLLGHALTLQCHSVQVNDEIDVELAMRRLTCSIIPFAFVYCAALNSCPQEHPFVYDARAVFARCFLVV